MCLTFSLGGESQAVFPNANIFILIPFMCICLRGCVCVDADIKKPFSCLWMVHFVVLLMGRDFC